MTETIDMRKLSIDFLPDTTVIPRDCAMCGAEFTEHRDLHDDRLVPMCFRCKWAGLGSTRGSRTGFAFSTDRDIQSLVSPLSFEQLLYRQTRQIQSAVRQLEEECKRQR